MYTGLTPYTQYYIHVMAKSSGAIGPAAVNNITTLAEGKVHIHTHTNLLDTKMKAYRDVILTPTQILTS